MRRAFAPPKPKKNDWQLLDERCRAIWDKINALPKPLCEQDRSEYQRLWEKIMAITAAFDRSHLIAPCPACGKPRRASLGESCVDPACRAFVPWGG